MKTNNKPTTERTIEMGEYERHIEMGEYERPEEWDMTQEVTMMSVIFTFEDGCGWASRILTAYLDPDYESDYDRSTSCPMPTDCQERVDHANARSWKNAVAEYKRTK